MQTLEVLEIKVGSISANVRLSGLLVVTDHRFTIGCFMLLSSFSVPASSFIHL